jgi:hypothetical protein
MHANVNIREALIWFMAVMIMLVCCCCGASKSSDSGQSAPVKNRYYNVTTMTLPNGKVIEKDVINGPPTPPPGFEKERRPVILPKSN